MSANDSIRCDPVKQPEHLPEELRAAQHSAELASRFDHRLASLNAPPAHRALNAFMDEPLDLNGQLRAGAEY